MTICQLCDLDKNLVEAHIIPKQLYNPIKEQANTEKQGEKTPWVYSFDENEKPKQVQNGIHDSSILCACCDNEVIGPWDKYGQNFLLNPDILSKSRLVMNSENSCHFEIDNFDYKKLKLFFMSILWRAAITKDPFFSRVRIGNWTDMLKKMIKEQNPGLKSDFSLILFKYRGEFSEIMQNPTRESYEGIDYFRFRFPNYGFLIKVDQRSFPGQFDRYILSPNDNFLVRYREYQDSREYNQILDTWGNNP